MSSGDYTRNFRTVFSIYASFVDITLTGGIATIGNSAFQGCIRIASLTISDSVTSIGESAFTGYPDWCDSEV